MYAYTLEIPAPADVYLALHRAVVEVVNETGGGEGLLLHLVRETDHGCELAEVWESKDQLDEFNNTVFPKAVARSECRWTGRCPEPVEFNPLTLMTPGAFTSDSRA